MLLFLFITVLKSIASGTRQEKEMKEIQVRKEEIKLLLFAFNMIIYVENLKESMKMLLELKSEFSKVTEYKVNIQKINYNFIYQK